MTRWLCKSSHCIQLLFLLEEIDSFCGSPLESKKDTSPRSITTGYSLWFISWNPIAYSHLQQFWQGIWAWSAYAWSNTIRILFEFCGVERYGCYHPLSHSLLKQSSQLLEPIWANYFCDTSQQTPLLLKNHWSRNLLEQQDTLRKLRSHCFHPMPKAYILHFICLYTILLIKRLPKTELNRNHLEHFLVKVYPNPASAQNSEIWTHFTSWHWYK